MSPTSRSELGSVPETDQYALCSLFQYLVILCDHQGLHWPFWGCLFRARPLIRVTLL